MSSTLNNTGIEFPNTTANITASRNAGRLISINSWASPGTYTWNKPANCTKVLVQVQGAGGGGAGYCESGGAGGYSEKLIDVTSISSVTVTVGAGGANTGYYSAANNGGTSSFGSYLSASGGYGANTSDSHTGGISGNGFGGDINLRAGSGTGHGNTGHRDGAGASNGGKSYFGSGYKASHSYNASNWGRTAPGAGGAGGCMESSGWVGNKGGDGIVIVYNYS